MVMNGKATFAALLVFSATSIIVLFLGGFIGNSNGDSETHPLGISESQVLLTSEGRAAERSNEDPIVVKGLPVQVNVELPSKERSSAIKKNISPAQQRKLLWKLNKLGLISKNENLLGASDATILKLQTIANSYDNYRVKMRALVGSRALYLSEQMVKERGSSLEDMPSEKEQAESSLRPTEPGQIVLECRGTNLSGVGYAKIVRISPGYDETIEAWRLESARRLDETKSMVSMAIGR